MWALRWSWLLVVGACFAPEPIAGSPCGPGDVCPSGLSCIAGVCVTSGGSGSSDECMQQPDGTPCGSATTSECNARDTCVAGACVANQLADGAACYDCAAGATSCASCAQGTCRDVECQPTGTPRVGVLKSSPNANNGDEGSMFDVVAAETITITSFDCHCGATGSTDYEIWTRPGTYVGFDGSETGWTHVGSATFTAGGNGVLTPVPIAVNITIAAGQRQAFYLTNHASNNRYHDGTQVGATLVSTPELTIYEGAGVNFGTAGFSGINAPRAWEGKVHYVSGGGALATAMTGATASDGVMFDITPARDLELELLGVQLAAGTHDIDVFFKRGSFAGAETSAAQWKPLASLTGVVSAGIGTSTPLPTSLGLVVESGATTALYVTGSGALRTGTDAGTTSNADLAIKPGVAVSGTFGGAGAAGAPNVELGYDACN